MNLGRKGQMQPGHGCCSTSHTTPGGQRLSPGRAARAGKDSGHSDGQRSFEGFHDRAIPPGRLKVGGISTAF